MATNKETSNSRGIMAVAIFFGVALVILFAYGGIQSSTPEGMQKAADREKIDRCHEAENDPLSELSTRRLMRQACVQLENKFYNQWGVNP